MDTPKTNTLTTKPAGDAGPNCAPVAGSAPTYDVFLGNNDYDTTGSTPAEALSEISFEMETAMSAVLLLRHGMTRAEAIKAVDDLRWLVEQSDLPNAEISHEARKTTEQ
jgi:hypothetical protein